MANTAKIAINLSRQLLDEVDKVSNLLQLSRSALVRQALKAFLTEYREQQTLMEAKQLYAKLEQTDKQLNSDFFSIFIETLSASANDSKHWRMQS